MLGSDYDAHDGLGLAKLVRDGAVKPEELLDEALARVRRLNPGINAVVDIYEARAREAIAAGLPKGPFRGVPYLVKDLNTFVAGEKATNGSRFFRDFVAPVESEMVARQKAAGLVIFGKTNTPEFGWSVTTEPLLFGPTRNPWNTDYSTGGSSGGAAAAVASGMVPIAHATDSGGSIRIPASACGLFGLKPTRGRVPMGPLAGEGLGGLSSAHAITRSVRDSAALLDAVDAEDPGAPYRAPPKARPYLDEVGAPTGKLRIAISTRPVTGTAVHPDCELAAERAARVCSDLGHIVEDDTPEVPDGPGLMDALDVIAGANIRAAFEDRAEALGRRYGTDDVEPLLLWLSERAKDFGGARYVRAIRLVHATGRAVARFMERYDVLLTPTLAAPPARIGELAPEAGPPEFLLERLRAYIPFTVLMNFTGQPAMSVPLHWNEAGLPIGVQFAGRFGDEATLFRLAAQLEEARPWKDRRPAKHP
jgi:Asp-tRNA(Asn)/Glu-tRNA(Gln) amidotransferase A subunit family amidase